MFIGQKLQRLKNRFMVLSALGLFFLQVMLLIAMLMSSLCMIKMTLHRGGISYRGM